MDVRTDIVMSQSHAFIADSIISRKVSTNIAIIREYVQTAERAKEEIMTMMDARMLKKGDMVHHITRKNADGTPMRARVTSVKTWKTRPLDIVVHVKRGMYEYAAFDQNEIYQIDKGEQ